MKSFIHAFIPSPSGARDALLLLHGTGGNERSLLELGAFLDPDAALLSPRGKVLEEGSNRFFRRFAEGVFDVEDVRYRAAELSEWLRVARDEYEIDRLTAVGFSNGANMATSLLLLHPDILDGVVAIRAQKIFQPRSIPDLRAKPVLLLEGEQDPMVSSASAFGLAGILAGCGAPTKLCWVPSGHTLTRRDVVTAQEWLAGQKTGATSSESPDPEAIQAGPLFLQDALHPPVGPSASTM